MLKITVDKYKAGYPLRPVHLYPTPFQLVLNIFIILILSLAGLSQFKGRLQLLSRSCTADLPALSGIGKSTNLKRQILRHPVPFQSSQQVVTAFELKKKKNFSRLLPLKKLKQYLICTGMLRSYLSITIFVVIRRHRVSTRVNVDDLYDAGFAAFGQNIFTTFFTEPTS